MRWTASACGVARSGYVAAVIVLVLGAAVFAQERPEATAGKAELIAFERRVEAAVLEADVAFLDRVCAEDFTYTHGDGWTWGGAPLSVDTKAAWLASLPGRYTRRDVETQHVEIHGDVGLTTGLVRARIGDADSGRSFTFWYVRVYERRDRQWRYLSHRTVHGPVSDE